jgi:hypothetical protein
MKFHRTFAAAALVLYLVLAPAKADLISGGIGVAGPNIFDTTAKTITFGDATLATVTNISGDFTILQPPFTVLFPSTIVNYTALAGVTLFLAFNGNFSAEASLTVLTTTTVLDTIPNLLFLEGTGTLALTGLEDTPALFSLSSNVTGTTTNFSLNAVAVPGPIAGAGLPGLLLAGGGFLAWWRSKRKAAAVAV